MINSRSLNDLHPALKRGAEELKRRMAAKGYDLLVTCTYRDFEAQDKLYAQGRTAPGNRVTNAKGGQSIHNFKLAFDICLNIKGKEYKDSNFFAVAGRIWQEMGGEWGGSWTSFPDRPHFQYTGGLSLKDLQTGKKLADNAKMPWESAVNQPVAPSSPEFSGDNDDRELLCKLVHWEARGEDERGQMLVVYTVLNRVAAKGKGFPNTIREVVYQSGQFGPVKQPGFESTVPLASVVSAVGKALLIKDSISQGALYFGSDKDMESPFFANAIADGRICRLFKHGGHWFLK